MLFARFLAENHLLIHPEHGIPIPAADIDDLAREAGEDPRDMAARFAQDSLPQIFRTGDPVLEVTLAPETRQALDKLLDDLPAAVFTADDSLGWTYQYWQTEKKDEVNASGNKIGADELPAVTQLFTEHYMVLFLYHNTIGAWHAGKVLAENPSLAEKAQSEEELRQAVRLQSQGGYDFEYLRFVRKTKEGEDEDKPTGAWCPAASTFEGWATTAKELRVLDPCCGSGHFLIEGFELMVRLRMDEEELDLEDAIRGVLADNLHGLELDARCTQIAAFNVAMAAWSMAGRPIDLPELQIACSGLAVGATKKEWTKLAEGDARLEAGMAALYGLFEQAPELGSLINPKSTKGDMFDADYFELQPLLEKALARESDDVENTERAVAAQGMARAAELLSAEYTLVITNVPYLGRGQQGEILKNLADEHCEEAKNDLATIFISRILDWLCGLGTAAVVSPQNWLFQPNYKRLRELLLTSRSWNIAARLGPRAFQTPMWDFNVMLWVVSACKPRQKHTLRGLDVSPRTPASGKAAALRGEKSPDQDAPLVTLIQRAQLQNPIARILLRSNSKTDLLGKFADCYAGLSGADIQRFVTRYWEAPKGNNWEFMQNSFRESSTANVNGMSFQILWGQGEGPYYHFVVAKLGESGTGAWIRGEPAWGRDGVTIVKMQNLQSAQYFGDLYGANVYVLTPKDKRNLLPILAYTRHPDFPKNCREVDQKTDIANQAILDIPFDLERWRKVAAEKYPNGLPEPYSDDPTQWLFHGHPAKAEPATILQVAVGRLLGYHWPPEFDPEMRLADEAREWVARCDELNAFADTDGIVCLSATRGERSAADRLRALLSVAFGSDWSAAKERELLSAAGDAKKPAASLEVWLRDNFFEEHCKLFHHRPFIWHIWDGEKDGFHCLVNAHRLTGPEGRGRRTLEAITYSYLGDWIDRQKADQKEGKEGADAHLASAQHLQGELQKVLEGEPPYDLFVRWKPLHEQASGWEPDINDGVRLNIRPFMNAELRKGGKKGAGILRWKPNVKWNKDRGKEPQSLRPKADFPWFWGCPGEGTRHERTDYTTEGTDFDGNRWNDLHYTIACKKAARQRAAGGLGV